MARLALAAVLALSAAAPAVAQDGAQIFNSQCKMCHQAKSSPMAPALAGVYGAKAASRPGYKYSEALKKKGGVWNDANLDAWLSNPQGYAPGTKMLVRVPQPERRKALIAYLKTLK